MREWGTGESQREQIGWGKHKGQDRADKADLGQVSGWQGGKSGGHNTHIFVEKLNQEKSKVSKVFPHLIRVLMPFIHQSRQLVNGYLNEIQSKVTGYQQMV